MPPIDLDRLERLLDKTTLGPWKVVDKGNTVRSYAIPGVCSGITRKNDTAFFIAACRTVVPEMIAELRQARARLELTELAQKWAEADTEYGRFQSKQRTFDYPEREGTWAKVSEARAVWLAANERWEKEHAHAAK